MCLKFADLEQNLGKLIGLELFIPHCSQMCDPRTNPDFWKTWKEFEVRHGNEDTMREMLRIKRSVQATYNTQVNFMSAQMLSAAVIAAGIEVPGAEKDSMQNLEAQAKLLAFETPNEVALNRSKVMFVRGEATDERGLEHIETNNPDEINLDDSDDDDDDEKLKRYN
ncbi:pre-mRNA-splicing factor SYF1 [Caerostris extrusa]|uniref:Pre-mRNA-splicing factor SYF1 n=1 Tax=Caerostris extrusa TaxID=172846 RepID=A0AAV4YBV2_CAEEX|nr:pre-mRNA-splicing factor SYF1 [Caerostris extrusa]